MEVGQAEVETFTVQLRDKVETTVRVWPEALPSELYEPLLSEGICGTPPPALVTVSEVDCDNGTVTVVIDNEIEAPPTWG